MEAADKPLVNLAKASLLRELRVLTSLDLANGTVDSDGMATIFNSCPRLDSLRLTDWARLSIALVIFSQVRL